MGATHLVDLAQFGLTESEVQHALGKVKVRDVDYADLYFESTMTESVSMEEGIVKRALKAGVILLQAGPQGNVISITPPLVISEQQLFRAIDVIEACIE